jgi:hypothetical protein
MVAAVDQGRRLILPARIQLTGSLTNSLQPRLSLVDRIAELPYIVTVENDTDTLHFNVSVYLQQVTASLKKRPEPVRFCKIDHAGIDIFGLDDTDKQQVLSSGWCRTRASHVLMYLPRDDAEVEICWNILMRAYDQLYEQSTQARPIRAASAWTLPSFSRTNLQ